MSRKFKIFSLIILIFLGFIARMYFASGGYTYDMESYELVANIFLNKGNVYGSTERYNYGPFWIFILSFIKLISFNNFYIFRYSIAILLSCVDILIFIYFYKKISFIKAAIIYLNPISIIITGHYSQFDNLALIIGLLSISLINKRLANQKYELSGYILLGFSLVIKHFLILYPIWLVFKFYNSKKSILLIIVPYIIFLVSFIPFISNGGLNGIINNVFLYKSFNNYPLWSILLPDFLKRIVNPTLFFVIPLFIGGYLFRKRSIIENFLMYILFLVIFSQSIAEQYYIYIIPAIIINFNLFFLIFILIQTVFLFVNINGGEYYFRYVNLYTNRALIGFNWQNLMLFFGLIYSEIKLFVRVITIRTIIFILIFLNLWFYVLFIIPSHIEDLKVTELQVHLDKGEFEIANNLYVQTQINPPFSNSRYFEKLTSVRNTIEDYRFVLNVENNIKNGYLIKDYDLTLEKLRSISNTTLSSKINFLINKLIIEHK